MRGLKWGVASLFLAAQLGGAAAQSQDITGKWSFSGIIVNSRIHFGFAQICDLQQTGGQIAGPCHGPNGACSAVGVVSGVDIDLTCRSTQSNNPNIAGVLTFHGKLGGDGIVRGHVSHSLAPGWGDGAMMRV